MANILAIDTSTEACSVALTYNGETDFIFEICPQQHSQKILTFVDQLLARNQIGLNAIDTLAYGCGPGSFTGVRIAASTVQGLAFGTDLPVAQVSTLAAMCYQNYKENKVSETLALIDARMNEVYSGYYRCSEDGILHLAEEQVVPPEEMRELVAGLSSEQFVGTGYEAYQDVLGIKTLPKPLKVEYPNAVAMLEIADFYRQKNALVDAESIAPTYLRDKVTWKKLPGRE
ncbi:tRNA (adenosine(37)-N6)-threonylcarbamoyltransferase complex dimerization subunit type 1 TsaB [Glaciecola sp. 1036]|uniref:tRNA (adenosine(37)-N6)-threonylcarbamoyltransferase complex dimerization subunit type 1 TsaB n=1 Tax=Alteromonadaceae TaxID=72275 RepID=UPI003D08CDC9